MEVATKLMATHSSTLLHPIIWVSHKGLWYAAFMGLHTHYGSPHYLQLVGEFDHCVIP